MEGKNRSAEGHSKPTKLKLSALTDQQAHELLLTTSKMKKHLLRTLVVALMTMIGGNAWADNYFTQDYEGDGVTADWTSGNTDRYTVDMKATGDPANNYLTVNAVGNGNNGTTITSTSVAGKVANDKDFTMEFDLQITNGNNQASSFYVYDSANDASKAFFALVAPSTGTKWNIQGSADHQVELAKDTWYTFKIAKSAGITYLTLTNKATGDKLKDQAIIPTLSEAGGLGNMVFNTKRYYAYMAIDNVVVRDVESTDAPASTPTTYTLKYVDGNSTALKEDVIINSIAGIEVAASSDQIADFKTGEGDNQKKWIYVSGNNSITTVEAAESNVITLVYREAGKFSYTFTAKSGDLLLETYPVATGFELDNIKVPYHHYYFTDGKIYQKGATSSEYNYSFILDSNNKEVGINDYAILEKDNVIFFAEAENLKALTPITDGLQASRNSFAAGAFASEYVPFITLAPGTYTLTAAGYGGTYSFMNGETSVLNMEQAGYWREITSEEFTLETSTDITFKGGVGATGALDYIYIQSTNGSAKEYEKPFDPATAIVNAGFKPEADPLGWDKVTSGSFFDLGMGLIGTYQVRGEHPAATVDETHLATEFAAGLECRWQTNYAAFTQTTAELPAGAYKLTFDVENTNATTTKANYENRFNVTVGETTYADESTEWMDGKSAWTTHTIAFTLTEASPITISLGYGTGSNNFGVGNTPALFVSHLTLEAINSIEIALIDLQAAIEAAQAKAATYTVGTEFFTYAESEIKPLNDAIATAQAAYTAAESAEAVKSATETLNAFVATFAPVMNKPAADKAYAIANATATGNLCITEGKVSVAKDAKVFFTAVEGGYVLSNEAGDYIFKTTENNWTLSTTKEIASAYVVTIVPVEGGYTIKGAKGLFGLDSTDEGSTVYANKAQSNNGLWTIAEYVAPEPVKTDYTDLIVNADLTNTETKGWDETETKGIDGSGIVKVSSGKIFDFNQTIANLPAGKYKVTAQAAYRYSDGEAREADSIAAGVNTKFAKLYATVGTTTVDTLVQNRYDGASETNLFNGEGGVSVVNEKFVPNSSDAVKAWFAAGKYVNEVVFNLPADGAVTIGIVKTQSPEESDYTVIGPWTLTRLGDAEVEPEPEPEPQPGDDMTKYIVNPSFETGNLTGWTVGNSSDTGVKPNSNATYTTEGVDGDYLFNTWWQGIPITQTVKGLPNGKYELKALMTNDAITAGNKACLYLLANGAHSEAFSSANAGVFAEGSMQFYVTDGTATIGAVGGNADGTFNEGGYYWYKADNFRLTYVEALPKIEDIEIPEGKMSIAAANAMTAAKEAGDVVALIQAVNNAKSSIAAYAHVKELLDFVAEEAAKTNVYTAAAKEKFDSICTATLNGYNEGTISDADAAAFNYGSRLDGILPNLLLSAYTSIVDGTPYINTWSTEGNNDGSEFKVPFYEYWVGDNDALAANTITAKVEGLKAGDYDVTAWVRVRMKNGVEAPATGITMQANDGEAVNVAAGDQVGTSQMYLKEFTATGTVAEDGVLKIKFNVAADNNISWLSFKNVKFEKKAAAIEPIEGISYSWESPAGEPIEWGGTIAYVNGDGDRLNYQNSGYYTICLNGKKANLTDTVASANAGKMVITLDKAVAEGDTIAYTAYITKDKSATAAAYILFENGTNVNGAEFGDAANIHTNFNGVPQTDVIVVPAGAAGSKTITLTRGQTGTNLFITKLQIIEKKAAEPQNTELALVLNVERYPGMGYGVTEATVDFSEAKEFLGVEAITTDMLSIVNPDSTTISDYAPYDGWFNGEGAAETWGNNTKVCVKFFEAIAGEGKYSICDMNGADSIGATYSVKWQLAANDKKVIYTINVTFVEKPVITLTFADLTKKDEQTVALTSTLGSNYEGLTADVDIAAILAKLEVSSLNDVTIYAVQSDGSLDDNYKLGTTDGWRNAAGDWQTWGDDAYFFVKADFTKESAQIYEAGGMENKNTTADWENPASYTATYAFVKTGSTDAVVLKVTLTYTVPTGINAIATDAQKSVIFNMNGQKVNKAHKGLYIINGKKVVIK